MSLINADKYIERLRQTLKDTKSIGVNKLSSTEKYDYLSNRCSDIIRDYDLEYNETLMELWDEQGSCLLYTSPSPRDQRGSRMPASA